MVVRGVQQRRRSAVGRGGHRVCARKLARTALPRSVRTGGRAAGDEREGGRLRSRRRRVRRPVLDCDVCSAGASCRGEGGLSWPAVARPLCTASAALCSVRLQDGAAFWRYGASGDRKMTVLPMHRGVACGNDCGTLGQANRSLDTGALHARLQRSSLNINFKAACSLPGGVQPPGLSLIPHRQALPR